VTLVAASADAPALLRLLGGAVPHTLVLPGGVEGETNAAVVRNDHSVGATLIGMRMEPAALPVVSRTFRVFRAVGRVLAIAARIWVWLERGVPWRESMHTETALEVGGRLPEDQVRLYVAKLLDEGRQLSDEAQHLRGTTAWGVGRRRRQPRRPLLQWRTPVNVAHRVLDRRFQIFHQFEDVVALCGAGGHRGNATLFRHPGRACWQKRLTDCVGCKEVPAVGAFKVSEHDHEGVVMWVAQQDLRPHGGRHQIDDILLPGHLLWRLLGLSLWAGCARKSSSEKYCEGGCFAKEEGGKLIIIVEGENEGEHQQHPHDSPQYLVLLAI